MDYIFAVTFLKNTKPQYFLSNYEVKQGELVVAESLKGIEVGRITTLVKEYELPADGSEIPFSYILRVATEEDLFIQNHNEMECEEIIKIVQKEANNLALAMNVSSAEYTLDRAKLTISYISEDRVDFRELLKVLASLYHCRIELRQIGPRDKAKMIGGIGICGLRLCCSSFLNEFDGISITMAKNQMLALNIPKLSGHCGKLICCLKYEDETYTLEKQNLPRVGLRLKYNDINYRIASINIITKTVRLESPDSIENVPLSALEGIVPYTYVNNVVKNLDPIHTNIEGRTKEEPVVRERKKRPFENVKVKEEVVVEEIIEEVIEEVIPDVVDEEMPTFATRENIIKENKRGPRRNNNNNRRRNGYNPHRNNRNNRFNREKRTDE